MCQIPRFEGPGGLDRRRRAMVALAVQASRSGEGALL